MPERMRWHRGGIENSVERMIVRELSEQDYTAEEIRVLLEFLRDLDGLWSWGTFRMVKDLNDSFHRRVAARKPLSLQAIRKDLREEEWSARAIDQALQAVDLNLFHHVDAWTVKAMLTLEALYSHTLFNVFGEPPDGTW